LTSEEVTAQRRKDRKVTKLVKKAEREAEKLAAASASASKRGSTIGGSSPVALAASLPEVIEEEEDNLEENEDEDEEDEGLNKLVDEDENEELEELEEKEGEMVPEGAEPEEEEAEEPTPTILEPAPPRWQLRAEHTQLQQEEAFFLSFALGTLSLRTSNPLALIPQPLSAPLSILQLWSTFLLDSATTRLDPAVDQSLTLIDPRLTRWDSPFLLSYVAYHHYRSMGWVIRSGVKFCADWVVYGPGGPVGSHAE
jgi:tRNA-splicing endonuclease subunit Sen2